MKKTSIENKVKKASNEELLATSRLLTAAKSITEANSPNAKLAVVVEKELNKRIKAGSILIIERNV